MSNERVLILSENTHRGNESGAGLMRNRCAFTSRDMGADWPEAFTYAVVMGWDNEEDPSDVGAWQELAAKFGWDSELIGFLIDAHRRFEELSDKLEPGAGPGGRHVAD